MTFPTSFPPRGSEAAAGAAPLIACFGPDAPSARTLLHALTRELEEESAFLLAAGPGLYDRVSAVVCAADPLAAGSELDELAAGLAEELRSRGRRLEPGGLPVFLVLVGCERLAASGDSLVGWLERLESAKGEALARFRRQLRAADSRFDQGFGSVRLHVWAVAAGRPSAPDAPDAAKGSFGVAELRRQLAAAAADYLRRSRRRSRRLALALGLLVLLCAALAGAAGLLISGLVQRPVAAPAPVLGFLDQAGPLRRAEKTLLTLKALLRFDGYEAGETGQAADWPRWQADAAATLDAAAKLDRELATLEAGTALRRELAERCRGVAQLRNCASVLGLPGAPRDYPAALAFAPGYLKHGPAQRLEALRGLLAARLREYAAYSPRPADASLPVETPLGVVRELELAARLNHDALLEPVREEVRERVRLVGKGQETFDAWQQLAHGWLAHQAPAELAELREISGLLQRLAGSARPHDPLLQLRGFLDRSTFVIPFDPVAVEIGGQIGRGEEKIVGLCPAAGPLEIVVRGPADKLMELRLPLVSHEDAGGGTRRYVYAATRDSPLAREGGRLQITPADVILVKLRAEDAHRREWDVLWAPADRTKTHGFLMLVETPECVAKNRQTRILGHGIRLRLGEESSLFRPDLWPY